jgi:hypothetical protein
MTSGVCMLGFILAVIIIASPAYSSPEVVFLAWFITFFSMQTISFTHILVFVPPKDDRSKQSSDVSDDQKDHRSSQATDAKSSEELMEQKPEKGVVSLP